jgi:hypothetical protein
MNEAHPVPKPARTPSQRGKASKRKGYRKEKEVAHDLGGERVPLSGALGGKLSGDVEDALGRTVEVKSRKDGFKFLYACLCIEPNTGVDQYDYTKAVKDGRKVPTDYLVVCADNSPKLVVLPMKTWQMVLTELANARAQAERGWVPRAIEHLESLGRAQ